MSLKPPAVIVLPPPPSPLGPAGEALRELLDAAPAELTGVSPEQAERYRRARHVAEAVLGAQ